MKLMLGVLVLIFQIPVQAAGGVEQFLGTWQSDEARTLADIRSRDTIPPEVLAKLENGVFGRLMLIIRAQESAAYFVDDPLTLIPHFEPHKITELSANHIVIGSFDRLHGTVDEQHWYFEDGFIYSFSTAWQFREFFRRIE